MSTHIRQIYDLCQNKEVPYVVAEEIVKIVNDYVIQEYENGSTEGYETARQELYNVIYQEGYEKGKADGEQLGRDHAITDIEMDTFLPYSIRTRVIEHLRG